MLQWNCNLRFALRCKIECLRSLQPIESFASLRANQIIACFQCCFANKLKVNQKGNFERKLLNVEICRTFTRSTYFSIADTGEIGDRWKLCEMFTSFDGIFKCTWMTNTKELVARQKSKAPSSVWVVQNNLHIAYTSFYGARPYVQLTIGSCFSGHYRVMEHAGSLESTKEA